MHNDTFKILEATSSNLYYYSHSRFKEHRCGLRVLVNNNIYI